MREPTNLPPSLPPYPLTSAWPRSVQFHLLWVQFGKIYTAECNVGYEFRWFCMLGQGVLCPGRFSIQVGRCHPRFFGSMPFAYSSSGRECGDLKNSKVQGMRAWKSRSGRRNSAGMIGMMLSRRRNVLLMVRGAGEGSGRLNRPVER